MIAAAKTPSMPIAAACPGKSSSCRARGICCVAPRQPQTAQADRQVDQKNAAPAGELDQSTAGERPGGERKARACRPHADRSPALFLVRISVSEQSKRVRHQDGGTQALRGARREEDRRARRQGAAKRRRGEDCEAGDEDFLGAEAIAQCARGQDESRKGDRVGADDPLQLGHAAAERGADTVQGRVDDGDVELHEAIAETHGGKRQRLGQPRTNAWFRYMFEDAFQRMWRLMGVAKLLMLWRKALHCGSASSASVRA
jgi:hypothetical protein